MAAAAKSEEILVEECGQARVVILNRPKKLNTLTLSMVERLRQLYDQWKCDNRVSLLILKGSGKAFCAGFDLADIAKAGDPNMIKELAYINSQLNYVIGTYTKPQVALIDGVVIGASAGVSILGPIRVVTENTVFSMPETGLGFHPGAGGSYFLSHLHGFLGEYTGLTGAQLDGAEMLACGLATHFVPADTLSKLEKALKTLTNGDFEVVRHLVNQYAKIQLNLKAKSALHRLAKINNCFSKPNVEQILKELEIQGDGYHGWAKECANRLRRASPLSLKITLQSIRKGRQQSLADCLKREYRLTIRCQDEFLEGIRAFFVEKDKNPKWNHPSLNLVTKDKVDHCFSPLKDNEARELEFFHRHENSIARINKFSKL